MDLRSRILHRFSRAGLAHAACFDLVRPAVHLPSQVEGFPDSIVDARNGEISGRAESPNAKRQTPYISAVLE